MTRYVLAIDQGTTGNTVLVIDEKAALVGRATREFTQYYPQPGWVEHDAEEIFTCTIATIADALQQAGIKPSQVEAIGITNQRETTVLWDRQSSVPIHRAIVWQCRRTAGICKALRERGLQELFREVTGLVIDPYFSATKIAWLLDHVESARGRAERGDLAFGTIDTWLTWKLTGGRTHVTDVSNASRTLLLELATLDWNDQLLEILRVPSALLPRVCSSSEIYGETRGMEVLPDGIPIAGIAGDQQAALFGQACFEAGEAKCTYGTGAFLVMNTGTRIVRSSHGLVTSVAWKVGDEVRYALEGSVFTAGAAVQWLRDGLGLIETSPQIEALASQVADSGGLVFVPALTGLGAPHWREDARGAVFGINRGTTKAHLARATLEGVALQCHDVLTAMEKDLGSPVDVVKVDGGASANNLLMQIQADLLRRRIERPRIIETTGLGAAMLAGLATSVWPNTDVLREKWALDKGFEALAGQSDTQGLIDRWRRAVGKV